MANSYTTSSCICPSGRHFVRTLASSNPDTPAYTEKIPCTDSVPCEIAAEDILLQMEQGYE
ncbi:MAG: hypothetical protein ACYC4N_26685 [Pirellulaceae bacterium]